MASMERGETEGETGDSRKVSDVANVRLWSILSLCWRLRWTIDQDSASHHREGVSDGFIQTTLSFLTEVFKNV